MRKKILSCLLCLCFLPLTLGNKVAVASVAPYSFVYKTVKLVKTHFATGYFVEYHFAGNVFGKTEKITAGTITILPPSSLLNRVGQLLIGKYVKAGFLISRQVNLTNKKLSVKLLPGQVGFYWYLEGKGVPVTNANIFSWNALFEGRALTPEGIYAIPVEGYATIGWFLTPSLYWEWAALTGRYSGADVFMKKTAGWAFYYYPQLLAQIYTALLSPKGVMYTAPASAYLETLYGFKGGFYDTRFNTDTANFLLRVGKAAAEPAYSWAASRYKNYFIIHSVVYSWYLGKGLLVADYSWSGLPKVITHASLNHNLAEINFLLRLGDAASLSFAKSILTGLAFSKAKWIAKNGDLIYAYYGNNDYHGKDYELLTLNDLKETLSLLAIYSWGKTYAPTLQYLLTTKENFLKKPS